MPSLDTLPERLTIAVLRDPIVQGTSYSPESDYVTWCYRPRLGPTGLVTWRFLAALLGDQESEVIDVIDAARNLGLRASRARNAPMASALDHLVAFGLAQWMPGEYALRLAVPPLSDRQAARLPEPARSIHDRARRGG
jgi:hypothetical protein